MSPCWQSKGRDEIGRAGTLAGQRVVRIQLHGRHVNSATVGEGVTAAERVRTTYRPCFFRRARHNYGMDYLTTRQAAEKLGISDRRVRELIAAGTLPATRFGERHLIRPADLSRARKRNTQRGRPKLSK